MIIPEISASKVAGFIGLNKYQSPAEIQYDLLNRNVEMKNAILSIENQYNRRSFTKVVNEVLKDQPIRECISYGRDACRKTTDIQSVLNEVEDQAKMVLSLRRDAYAPELRDRIAAEVRGQVSKQRGLENENGILNTYESQRNVQVTERNTKTVRKDYGQFRMIGRTDGYVASENRIVDSKDRTRMWPEVPIYDEIQLRAYMEMTGAVESELIERFPNKETRHTKYMNDPEKWKVIYDGIMRGVGQLNAIYNDPEKLKEVVFANTVCMT